MASVNTGTSKLSLTFHVAARCVLLLGLTSVSEYSRRAKDRWHVGNSNKNFKTLSFRLWWLLCVFVQLKCLSYMCTSSLGSSLQSSERRLSPAESRSQIETHLWSGGRARDKKDFFQDYLSKCPWVDTAYPTLLSFNHPISTIAVMQFLRKIVIWLLKFHFVIFFFFCQLKRWTLTPFYGEVLIL